MIRTAFSTTACPDWTLDRVARSAAEWGYAGVELRSFGGGGTELACEPALSDPEKVRAMFAGVGLRVASIATGVRFDTPVFPPVVGHILLDRDASIYEGRRFVELARATGASCTRVYAYGAPGRGTKRSLVRRIAERLRMVCDHGRHDAGHVVVENGGAFSSARDLMELVEAVDHPKLAVAYDMQAAVLAEDDVREGLALLDDLVRIVRVRDAVSDESRAFVESAAELVTNDAFVVLEHPVLWNDALAPAERVLAEAAPALTGWASGVGGRSAVA
ncbi:MAG: TIM barrel protein [Planctomycetota bacterium]